MKHNWLTTENVPVYMQYKKDFLYNLNIFKYFVTNVFNYYY